MNASSPEIVSLRGYDPESTSRCVTYADGKCLGELMPHGSLITWDSAVSPLSGEHAMIRLPGDVLTTKQLEHFAGRWFMTSLDGWHELDSAKCDVLGKIVRIVRYPLSRVLQAPEEPIPPGYNEHQSELMHVVGPLMVAHGLDRTTEYGMTVEAQRKWQASSQSWEIPWGLRWLWRNFVEPYLILAGRLKSFWEGEKC